MAHKLVLLRHGLSEWNRQNRFSGWHDVDLADDGATEAREAGRLLHAAGFSFDVTYTSVLKRAIRTLWIVLDEMDQMWLPIITDWRLNERHYGALQGLDKAETAAQHGEEQVRLWRRGFGNRPPALSKDDPRSPGHEARYAGIPEDRLPRTESLADTFERVAECWRDTLAPELRAGRRLLIVAHGNSLRALIKLLDQISDQDIEGLEVPTGIPLIYDLDEELSPLGHQYLRAA